MRRGRQWRAEADGDPYRVARAEVVLRIRKACDAGGEWPERVGAGLYALVGYVVEERQMAEALLQGPSGSRFGEPFRDLVLTVAEILDEGVPVEARLGPKAPAAAVAGVALLIGDSVRLGRFHRLPTLCPELHLMILLPFLGFDEAKSWAQAFHDGQPS